MVHTVSVNYTADLHIRILITTAFIVNGSLIGYNKTVLLFTGCIISFASQHISKCHFIVKLFYKCSHYPT